VTQQEFDLWMAKQKSNYSQIQQGETDQKQGSDTTATQTIAVSTPVTNSN
jgi:hypothetical protein